jgi:hypothetical protein
MLYERDHLLSAVGVLVIRQKLDSKLEDSLFRILTNFGMFNFTNESEHLLNIAIKDKATDVIKESLLNARKIGQKQLEDFETSGCTRERPPTQCCRSSCYPDNSTPFFPVAWSHS